MTTEAIVILVGLCASVTGILFSFIGYRRNERNDSRVAGKNEGTMVTDIAYIKSSVDRMEKNINSIDARYIDMTERLAKLEENVRIAQEKLEKVQRGGE